MESRIRRLRLLRHIRRWSFPSLVQPFVPPRLPGQDSHMPEPPRPPRTAAAPSFEIPRECPLPGLMRASDLLAVTFGVEEVDDAEDDEEEGEQEEVVV